MRIFKFLTVILICGLTFNACSKEEDTFQEESVVSIEQSSEKAFVNATPFCDDVEISNLTNGHQMRSRVDLSWTVHNDLPGLPELVNYNVQFQQGYYIGGVPTYGTIYNFVETEIILPGQQQIIEVSYYALSQLGGSVSGRWRVRAENCQWSAWKSHYFN